MSIVVKRVFVQKPLGVITIVLNSVENNTEWTFHNAQIVYFGSRYEHIMILGYYTIMISSCYGPVAFEYYDVEVV